jgi:hypothetical protein
MGWPRAHVLLLCSLNAVTKETATVTRSFRRSSPDPRLGPTVQLHGGDAGSSLNFFGISERLTSQRITAIESPPAFLHIQPACPLWNEHLMQALMVLQPRSGCFAVMTAQIIGDDVDISPGVGRLDLLQHQDVIG